MKNLFLIFLLSSMSLFSYAQNANWLWAKNGIGDGTGICTDVHGNIYVTGQNGHASVFIVKYDNNGNVIWNKSYGSLCKTYSITSDLQGNIFITGSFQGFSVNFDNITLYNTDTGNPINGSQDFFLVKINNDGIVQWARSAGNTNNNSEWGYSLCTDSNGNVYVTGKFNSYRIIFGSDTLKSSSCSSTYNYFIVKYDMSGNVKWFNGANTCTYCCGKCVGNDVTVDTQGNILVTGFFNGDSISFGNQLLTNNGSNDIFLVKYNTNGNVIWAKSAGGNGAEYGSSLSSDSQGNIFVTGGFQSSSINLGTCILTNTSAFTQFFLIKYDSSGQVVWAKSTVSNDNNNNGVRVCTNNFDNVIVTGEFSNTSISFGSYPLNNHSTNNDLFIINYSNNGDVVFAKSIGSTEDDYSRGVSIDSIGNIFIIGVIGGSNSSNSITFGSITLNCDGMFFAKYGINTSSLENFITKKETYIYPNPANDKIVISGLNNGTIEIINTQGQIVKTSNLTSTKTTVNLSKISGGVYTIKIITDNGIIVKQLIKQ